jgi:hypothetical protein
VLRVAACVACAALLAATGCGGERDDAPPVPDRSATGQQLQEALDSVGRAFDDGDPAAVCDAIGPAARRQVILIGHGSSKSCAMGIREWLLEPIGKGRSGIDDADKPTVTAVERRQTGVVVGVIAVEGRLVRVPFVEEGETWKVNSAFGLTPKASQIID